MRGEGATATGTGKMRRTAIDETGHVVDIRDVPQDMAERHRHSYTCESCGMRLIPKKGAQQIHHFAHASNVDCDPWNQSMTTWHIAGQDVMATLGARLEVPCDEGNVTHRADAVFDRHNTVVELQHSSMSIESFIERNEFYLRRFDNLVWLFDARRFSDRLVLRLGDESGGTTVLGSDAGCWDALMNRRDISGISLPSPRNWFTLMSSAPCYWTSRGVSVAMYVDGPSSFASGHVVELFPHADAPHALSCHVWDLHDWLSALSKGNLPFMRRGTVRYAFSDGSVEERTERYGSLVSPPEGGKPVPWYKTRTWRLDGKAVEPSSLIVPANRVLEFREMTYVTKAGVAVWLGRRRSRRRTPPDIDLWLPVNTPMNEVRRMVESIVGEERVCDYDWSAFPEREYLGERVSVTLPVIEGHERHRLAVMDAETGDLIGEAWPYAGTPVSDVLDEIRSSLPQAVADGYEWGTRTGTMRMGFPMEMRLRRKPKVRMVSVTVESDLGVSLAKRVVPSDMTWDEFREAVVPDIDRADGYDWGATPEPSLAEGDDRRTWVLRGLPRRVSVTLDGEEIASREFPYGCPRRDAIAPLMPSIPMGDVRFSVAMPDADEPALDDFEVSVTRDVRATHPVLIRDGMSSVMPREFPVPYWTSLLVDPADAFGGVPLPSPDWAGRFEGLFSVGADGEPVQVTNSSFVPIVGEGVLAGVSFLQYGYRHGGTIVFSREEAAFLRDRQSKIQMPLF